MDTLKLKGFKVGDTVRIKDKGKSYPLSNKESQGNQLISILSKYPNHQVTSTGTTGNTDAITTGVTGKIVFIDSKQNGSNRTAVVVECISKDGDLHAITMDPGGISKVTSSQQSKKNKTITSNDIKAMMFSLATEFVDFDTGNGRSPTEKDILELIDLVYKQHISQ